jgi:hypothetical protein
MAVKTDIEIAREATKKPIMEIGAKLGIPHEHLLPYGHDKAKVGQEFIKSLSGRPDGKLILVRVGNGLGRLEDARFSPEFGKVLPTQCIAVDLQDENSQVRLSWG